MDDGMDWVRARVGSTFGGFGVDGRMDGTNETRCRNETWKVLARRCEQPLFDPEDMYGDATLEGHLIRSATFHHYSSCPETHTLTGASYLSAFSLSLSLSFGFAAS